MDNVTHTLLGVLVGTVAARHVVSHRGAVWAAVLGSNLPDGDLVLGLAFEEPRLGYLVHHRGYTHTLVAAPILALVAWGVARWRVPAARPLPLYGVALLATLLHLVADAWNNYGVHPFWPLDARWFYGDFIFIAEPWLWVALLPLAWGLSGGSWLLRGAVAALGLAAAALGGVFVGADLGGALAFALLLGWRVERRGHALGWAILGIAVTLGVFSTGSRAAAGLVLAEVPEGEAVVEVARTPVPGLPWCWEVWVTSRDRLGATPSWRSRTASVSLLPALRSPARCALRPAVRTAPPTPVDRPDTPNIAWRPGFAAGLEELAALAEDRCRVAAFLRFGRIPYWTTVEGHLVVGDLRYDFEPELGFAEIEAEAGDSRGCGALPPWRTAAGALLLPGGGPGAGSIPSRPP